MKKTLLAGIVALLGLVSLQAVPVGSGEAKTAAENWLKRDGAPLKTALGKQVKTIRTINRDGAALFHCATVNGGGSIILSADTEILPIVAVIGSAEIDLTPGSPLVALLTRDLAARTAARQGAQVFSAGAAPSDAQARWAALLSPPAFTVQSEETLSDIRVAPLVESTWDQEGVGGENTYNYYTPNNWLCGCVATATAQIMRYHSWPTASTTPATRSNFVGAAKQSLTTRGGTFDWANMPLTPDSSITEPQRQAIGHLTYDLSVLLRAMYGSDTTSAYQIMVPLVLTSNMNYANACHILEANGLMPELANAVLANLDAGFPVIMGITESETGAGHSVVSDGYGYHESLLYLHLNMGWGGQDDVWYNFPTVDAGGYTFDLFDELTYNIFPTQTGQIISGRVLRAGEPVAGITVTASSTSPQATFTATTDANGIYALLVTAPSTGTRTYTVAAASGDEVASTTVSIAKSISADPTYDEAQSAPYYANAGTVGNRWGINLTLQTLNGVTFDDTTAEITEGETLSLTVVGGDATAATSVKYWIIPGTAGTSDYTLPKPHPGTLTWAAGEIGEKTIEIPIKADKAAEDDEFFFVQLGAPNGMALGENDLCTVTIRDANRTGLTLLEALDSPILKWTSTAWVAQTEITADGLHAAMAAPAVKKAATLQAAFTGAGLLTATIKIEDDTGDSTLQLWDGKALLGTWSGQTDWTTTAHPLANAAHTLKFTFTRGTGNARAFIDQTAFSPAEGTYAVTAQADNPDAGTVTGSGIYRSGTKAAFTASAKPGWELDGWSYSFANPFATKQTLTVLSDLTLSARFTRIPFIGAIALPAEGGSISGSGLCARGKKITLKTTPAKGYAFTAWSDGDQTPSRTFTQPEEDVYLTAHFKLITAIEDPAISPLPAQEAMVGLPFALTLGISSETLPTTTISGLPAGLKFDKTTLSISGRPTKAGTFTVKVKATNATKRAVEYPFTITVAPLPDWAVGAFSGILIDAPGGRADLTLSATGAISGSIETEAGKYTFKTVLDGTPDAISLAAEISQGKKLPSIPLALAFTGEGTLTGTFTTEEAPLTLWPDLIKRTPEAFTSFTGQYNIAIGEGEATPAGYFTLTLPAKSSKAKLAGRFTNGQAISASALCIPLEDGSLLIPLWLSVKKTGTLLTGTLQIAPDGTVVESTLAYRSAISESFTGLTPFGGLYTAPTINWAAFLPEGATLTLGEEMGIPFTFTKDSAAALKPLPEPLTAASLTLTRKTGLLTGKITYPGKLTYSYWGILLPSFDGIGYATGTSGVTLPLRFNPK